MKNAPYSRKIKRLVIKNFLNHKHTVIEFADGINLFAGSSSSGKSTIMRAWLGMVCDEYRSEWINNEADHCSVKIEFFKILFSIYAIQKNYPREVPNPNNYRRCKLFVIQD